MEKETAMQELEALGKERLKKMYIANGAREPLFGVANGEMKPLFKKIKINQPLAEELYATANYDAMYFAGVIADPKAMTAADYDRWMDAAYFYMLSDYVVAVTLSESDLAQEVADRWIASGEELRMSAGWSCYCWLLGSRKDGEFSEDKLAGMLDTVRDTIHAVERAKYAMIQFVYTTAISYVPLHERAVEIAKAMARNQLGFKRKHVRC